MKDQEMQWDHYDFAVLHGCATRCTFAIVELMMLHSNMLLHKRSHADAWVCVWAGLLNTGPSPTRVSDFADRRFQKWKKSNQKLIRRAI